MKNSKLPKPKPWKFKNWMLKDSSSKQSDFAILNPASKSININKLNFKNIFSIA
jgi:hypothetical protein